MSAAVPDAELRPSPLETSAAETGLSGLELLRLLNKLPLVTWGALWTLLVTTGSCKNNPSEDGILVDSSGGSV